MTTYRLNRSTDELERVDSTRFGAEAIADVPRRYVSFTVYGKAAPAGSKSLGRTKAGAAFVRDSSGDRGKHWRTSVGQVAAAAMQGHAPLDGPLSLEATFYVARPQTHRSKRGGLVQSAPPFPVTRPDLTKLLRAIEDAMTGIVWRDDAQVIEQTARKVYDDADKGVRVVITVAAVTRKG